MLSVVVLTGLGVGGRWVGGVCISTSLYLLFFCLVLSLVLSYPVLLFVPSADLIFARPPFFGTVGSFVWFLVVFLSG